MIDIPLLVRYLDSPKEAAEWLKPWGIENCERAHGNLVSLAKNGVTLDLLADICRQLADQLPHLSDPDMALNNLDRFVAASRSPLSLATLFERDREALPTLLQILSTSQYLSDLLVRDPESFDLVRVTEGLPVGREVLREEICSEADALTDDRAVMDLLRRYKQRETLRIAYGDIVRKQRLETVTEQISFLADAICEAALRTAWKKMQQSRGNPRRADGQAARLAVLALGKLGGTELNYSSDIDLVLVSDSGGKTDGVRSVSNQEFFDRLAASFVKLLTEPTELGVAYRVDLRLRPEGDQGTPVIAMEQALRYYDLKGRTWERQAFVKARCVAGSADLGREFLDQMEPWVYRRYLSGADITGIKALKRRIEQRVAREGADMRNIKTGHGGIRDIEFVIQFLQLLNGGGLREIRTGNTLTAIDRLEKVGCLTFEERSMLDENYVFLRRVEHRLQILFDMQTHTLPTSDQEMRRLAIRMGYVDQPQGQALARFRADLKTKTELNRRILNHLLSDAFGKEQQTEPETDLVLDPDPPEETLRETLTRHGFRDVRAAYDNLTALSQERSSFLSTHRCRHFLASIAPRLLAAISRTPDPDATLVNLSKVSDSLGGKGVLWELFSFNPPSLQLYVHLCASTPYLSQILISNPGMIDELMDSLVLDKLPTLQSLESTLNELCRGAEDIDPILHSFKNSYHLRVGVRDILGKENIYTTHRTLSDIAEVCLNEITRREFQRLVARYGVPSAASGDEAEQPCSPLILAMGKLGGREPNYHSDLDLIFVYEADGTTRSPRASRQLETTTNQHFFSQLGQRIIKVVTHMGPFGRLYELDSRLRPTGKSGLLAVSLDELGRYFSEGRGQLWERQALCKARPIFGTPEARQRAMQVVHRCITVRPWSGESADAIRHMRMRLQETASPYNLKRGPGGTVDIEFTVQMLQLKWANRFPKVLTPGTLDAIRELQSAGCLEGGDGDYLSRSYRFLRSIESGLRLMNTTARHDLPEDSGELNKLAFLLGHSSGESLWRECRELTRENRVRFDRIFDRASRDD
jgi:glutamate-ammonia-ligase adenylyltransferase